MICSGASFTGCYRDIRGTYFYTAGQRSGSSHQSTFVWRVTSGIAGNDAVSTMTYTNWRSGQPSYDEQSCLSITSANSYMWSDVQCSSSYCSVCELDIWIYKSTQTSCNASEWHLKQCWKVITDNQQALYPMTVTSWHKPTDIISCRYATWTRIFWPACFQLRKHVENTFCCFCLWIK